MTDNQTTALETRDASAMDVGRPVEWMFDPEKRDVILGVTYAFSQTGERKTVWYTANKRRAKRFMTVTDLPVAWAGPPSHASF